MTLTLDATPGGAAANSYVTQAEANTYFDGRVNADAWTGASSSDKDKALFTATQRLEQESWLGFKYALTQALKWPRDGVYDQDGIAYAITTIPVPVKQATYELALYLLQQGTTDPLQPTGLEPFSALTVGPLNLQLKDSPGAVVKSGLPPQTQRLLRNFMTSFGSVRLVRS